jgi:hypothetical protein
LGCSPLMLCHSAVAAKDHFCPPPTAEVCPAELKRRMEDRGHCCYSSIGVIVESPPIFSTTVSISRTRCCIVVMSLLQELIGALMKRLNGWELVTWWGGSYPHHDSLDLSGQAIAHDPGGSSEPATAYQGRKQVSWD